MNIIGIIAEYNPFHNGHLYHINKIKELYPDSILILITSGYFTQRGHISVLSKESKTKIRRCEKCNNLSEDDKCEICKDNGRNKEILCVV